MRIQVPHRFVRLQPTFASHAHACRPVCASVTPFFDEAGPLYVLLE